MRRRRKHHALHRPLRVSAIVHLALLAVILVWKQGPSILQPGEGPSSAPIVVTAYPVDEFSDLSPRGSRRAASVGYDVGPALRGEAASPLSAARVSSPSIGPPPRGPDSGTRLVPRDDTRRVTSDGDPVAASARGGSAFGGSSEAMPVHGVAGGRTRRSSKEPVALPSPTEAARLAPDGTDGNATLREIRRRIGRAKSYPAPARREGLEGRPEVEFAINPDGSVRSVQVVRASGIPLLDATAVATVHAGQPYPYYPGPIRFTIRFSQRP